MLLSDLAAAVRKSGLPVIEVAGWRTRGHGEFASVDAVVCHHTATSAKAAGDYPSLAIVRDGRADLPGPLCNLGLGRDGTVYVIAAGVAWHAGVVFSAWQGNTHAIGIEAEHDGLYPWPEAQRDAYAVLCATLADHYALPTARVVGHKEIASPAGRKPDPIFDMAAFREDVAALRKADRQAERKRARITATIAKLRAEKDRIVARIVRLKDKRGAL